MTKSPADPDPPAGEPAPYPAEIAKYAAQMSSELSAMARGARFELLAYLLEMVRVEAARRAGRGDSEGE